MLAGIRPAAERIDEFGLAGTGEPLRVVEEVVVSCDAGLLGRAQDAQKIVGFAESVLGVTEGEHGFECSGFRGGEGTDLFVAFEESPEVIEVDGDAVAGGGIVHEDEPFDDVAFDGVSEIVDGAGAVGEAEVDDGEGAGVWDVAAPEEVGGVEVVVGPEGSE